MPSPPREVRAPTSGSPGFDEAGARRRGGALRRKAAEGHVPADSVHRLRTRLMAQIRHSVAPGAQLELAVTDNRTTMISVRREPGRYRLRLHHMFVEAGADIVDALGRYVTRAERDASAALDAFIDQHASRISSRTPAAVRTRAPGPRLNMEPRGQHHDLEALYHELNASYFRGQICARITWAKRKRCGTPPRHHKSLRMGSYSVEDQLIRIHPTLDRPDVPRYYIAWIIYHEMLHQKHQIPLVAGRRCFHPPAFLAEERLFDEYERARRFEQQNLHRLLWY